MMGLLHVNSAHSFDGSVQAVCDFILSDNHSRVRGKLIVDHSPIIHRLRLSMLSRKFSRDEIGRRGAEIYQSKLRQALEPSCLGQFVAIDVESGAYEVADEADEASRRLWARSPEAQILIERVGHKAAFHAY